MVYHLSGRNFILIAVISTEMNTSQSTKRNQESIVLALANLFSALTVVETWYPTYFTILYPSRSLRCESPVITYKDT
jgi:hypothetical protein